VSWTLIACECSWLPCCIQPGVFHSCTRLTKLRFKDCRYINSHTSLAALSALVGLQHLQLGDDIDADADHDQLPGTVLQHLPHLTYLLIHDISAYMLDSNSLEHASCLTSLQELHIAGAGLEHGGVYLILSPSTVPGLSRLTALQHITLQCIDLDPSILQDCMQLQGLELQSVNIISAGGAAALHSLLARLQQLQSLELYEVEYDWPVVAAAFSSLTASSTLQKLHLTVDSLPAGVWPHVFPPDRQLPALQELTLDWHGGSAWVPPPAAAPGTDDLSSISVCCPGLCSINISVQPDAQLADLAKVSGLTNLSVLGLDGAGFLSLAALSGLVSLRQLDVDLGGPITPQDLLCLTALTGLNLLYVNPEKVPNFQRADDVELGLSQVCTYFCCKCLGTANPHVPATTVGKKTC